MKKKPPTETPPRRRHGHGVIHQLLMSLLRMSGRYEAERQHRACIALLMPEKSALPD